MEPHHSYTVNARWTPRDMWAALTWEGMPYLGPFLLPDGRDIMDLVADGDVDEVPFRVWCEQVNRGRRLGDLIWTTGTLKLASDRFVRVLKEIGASGWRTFDIEVFDRKGEQVPGYTGFATTGPGDDLDVSHLNGWQNFAFRVKPRVLEALRDAGVDRFEWEVTDISSDD